MITIFLSLLTLLSILGILYLFVRKKGNEDINAYKKRMSYMSEMNRWSHRHPTLNKANKFSFTNTYMKKP